MKNEATVEAVVADKPVSREQEFVKHRFSIRCSNIDDEQANGAAELRIIWFERQIG